MMRDDPGCGGALMLALLVLVLLGVVTGAAALPVLNGGGLSWDTSASQNYWARRAAMDEVRQREETARTIAREAESTQRNAALMLTLQVVAVAGMAGATVIVGVTQWGRTSRHRETERTRRVQLLEGYVARYYLPQANVEVRELPGRGVVVVDHDAGAIVPYSVARQVMRSQRDS